MFLLAHAGITLGCTLIVTNLVKKSYIQSSLPQETIATGTSLNPQQEHATDCVYTTTSRLADLITHIDYRLLLLGSLLPDIIDKPVGGFFFQDLFSNGRIFSHTLLFLIALVLASIFIYRKRGKTWLVVISFGVFFHLILDSMWRQPKTLLWPLYGFSFERINLSNWLLNRLNDLQSDPAVYISELLGALILVNFFVWLMKRKQFYAFVRSGSV
jgi:inner membrane protein